MFEMFIVLVLLFAMLFCAFVLGVMLRDKVLKTIRLMRQEIFLTKNGLSKNREQ